LGSTRGAETRHVNDVFCFQIVAKQLDLDWKRTTALATLQKRSGNTLDQMIELVHRYLHVEKYSKNEVLYTRQNK